METKEPPNAAEVKAAVKYWSRINRCPWRANGNAFYTRARTYSYAPDFGPRTLELRERDGASTATNAGPTDKTIVVSPCAV